MWRGRQCIGFVLSLVVLAIFASLMRLARWPLGRQSFNIWVNLPTFDPAAGDDIENRLIREARINVLFGITLPFLLPMAAYGMSDYFDFSVFSSGQTLIWMVTLWAYIPASLIMRGIALGKIARLIERKRQKLHDPASAEFSAV